MKKDNFLMSADWAEAFQLLPDVEAGLLIKAIYVYCTEGKEPKGLPPMAAMIFSISRNFFDENADKYRERCARNRENGGSGGRPRAEKAEKTERFSSEDEKNRMVFSENTKKPNGFSEKNLACDNEGEGDSEGDNDSEGEGEGESARAREDALSPSTAPPDHKFAFGKYRNVALTRSEYQKLEQKYPDWYLDRIDKLSEYLYAHPGKVYASHYDKIMRWAKEDAVPDGSEKHRSFDAGEAFEKAVEHGRREIKT